MADYKSINTRLVESFINDAKENKDVSNLKVVVDKIAETDFFLTSFAAVSRGYLTIFADVFHVDAPEPTPTNPEVTERTDALTKAYFEDNLEVCLDSVATYGDMEQRQESLKQVLKLLRVAFTHVVSHLVAPTRPMGSNYFQNFQNYENAPSSPVAPGTREEEEEADEEQTMPELVREDAPVCDNCGEIHTPSS